MGKQGLSRTQFEGVSELFLRGSFVSKVVRTEGFVQFLPLSAPDLLFRGEQGSPQFAFLRAFQQTLIVGLLFLLLVFYGFLSLGAGFKGNLAFLLLLWLFKLSVRFIFSGLLLRCLLPVDDVDEILLRFKFGSDEGGGDLKFTSGKILAREEGMGEDLLNGRPELWFVIKTDLD